MFEKLKYRLQKAEENNAANQLCPILISNAKKYGFEVIHEPRIEKRNIPSLMYSYRTIICFSLKFNHKAFPVEIEIYYFSRDNDYSLTVFAQYVGAFFEHRTCRLKCKNIENDQLWLDKMFQLLQIAASMENYTRFSSYNNSWGGKFLKANDAIIGITLNNQYVLKEDIINILGITAWNFCSRNVSRPHVQEGFLENRQFHSFATNTKQPFASDEMYIKKLTYNFMCGTADASRFYDSL